jgi:hypothetical protein
MHRHGERSPAFKSRPPDGIAKKDCDLGARGCSQGIQLAAYDIRRRPIARTKKQALVSDAVALREHLKTIRQAHAGTLYRCRSGRLMRAGVNL